MDWQQVELHTPQFPALTTVGPHGATTNQGSAAHNNANLKGGFEDADFFSSLPLFDGNWAENPRQPQAQTGTPNQGAPVYTSQSMMGWLASPSPLGASSLAGHGLCGVQSDGLAISAPPRMNDAAPVAASFSAYAGGMSPCRGLAAPHPSQQAGFPYWQGAPFSVPTHPWPWCQDPLSPPPPLMGNTYVQGVARPPGQVGLMLRSELPPSSKAAAPNVFESDQLLAEIEAVPWPHFPNTTLPNTSGASLPSNALGGLTSFARFSHSASTPGLSSRSLSNPATPSLSDCAALRSLETLNPQPQLPPQQPYLLPEEGYLPMWLGHEPQRPQQLLLPLPLLPQFQPLQPQPAPLAPLPQPPTQPRGPLLLSPGVQPASLPPLPSAQAVQQQPMVGTAGCGTAVPTFLADAGPNGGLLSPSGNVMADPACLDLNPGFGPSCVPGYGQGAPLAAAVAVAVAAVPAGGVEMADCLLGPTFGTGAGADAGTAAAATAAAAADTVGATAAAATSYTLTSVNAVAQAMPTCGMTPAPAPALLAGVDTPPNDVCGDGQGTGGGERRLRGAGRGRGRGASVICGAGGSVLPGGGGAGGGPGAGRVTLEDLRSMYELPVQEVVTALRISATDLKRRCRALGIQRWPQRKLVSLRRLAEAVEADKELNEEQRQEVLSLVARNRAQILEHPDTELEACLKPLRQAHYKRSFVDRHGISKN